MRNKNEGLYILQILLFISIIVFNVIYRNTELLYLSVILIGLITIKRYGLIKNNNYLNSNVTSVVVASLLSYFILIFLLGLVLGFNKTVFSFKIDYLVKYPILNAVGIILEELVRYIICKNATEKKTPIITYTILLIILNITIGINGLDIHESESMFIFTCTVVLPVISRETLCSYLTYKIGYTPSIIFKLVISLYEYVVPIVPDLGNYLYSVFNVALPYFVYLFSGRIIDYRQKAKIYTKNAIKNVFYAPIFVFLVILVALVSNVFSHTIIAIGSNSMKPIYERGDAVIYEKVNPKSIKVGEVIAFKRNGIIITHRVISLQKNGNNYIFMTKGDANSTPDAALVYSKDLLGRVKYSVKYIGYPTLWFNEVINGKEISAWVIKKST